jgi:hypothetical protein
MKHSERPHETVNYYSHEGYHHWAILPKKGPKVTEVISVCNPLSTLQIFGCNLEFGIFCTANHKFLHLLVCISGGQGKRNGGLGSNC